MQKGRDAREVAVDGKADDWAKLHREPGDQGRSSSKYHDGHGDNP